MSLKVVWFGVKNFAKEDERKILITAQSHEGEINEEVECRKEVLSVSEDLPLVRLKSRYLVEAIKHVNSEEVSMVFQKASTPTCIMPKNSNDWMCVIVSLVPREKG